MKTMLSALMALALLAGAATQGSAAQGDCKVTGWTDGYQGKPIWQCPKAE